MARQCLIIGGLFAGVSLPVRGVVFSAVPPDNLRRASRHTLSSGLESGFETDAALAKALDSLWEGVDFRNDSYSFRYLAPKPDEQVQPEKSVQVLGLQHAGTNLLSAMLYINFGNQLNYVDLEYDQMPAPNVSALWRHANLKELYAQKRDLITQVGENVHAIAMVRDPFSWLHVVHEYPFELASCVDGDDWLFRTCSHSCPGGPQTDLLPKEYTSLIGIWNQWNDGYLNADGLGIPHRRVIRYEDLVGNPDAIMDQVANFLGMEKPATGWKVLNTSPIDGEQNSARETAFEHIHDLTYMNQWSMEDQRKVCSHIDADLKVTYNYAKACDGLQLE